MMARKLARNIPEKVYRKSRICRLLANPTAFYIVELLLAKGATTPSELSCVIGRGVTVVSASLRHLRNVDIVRYSVTRGCRLYELKYPAEVKGVLRSLGRLVGRTVVGIGTDM